MGNDPYFADRAGVRYAMLSTDSKPGNVPAGTMLVETDTGDQYVFDGANWLAGEFGNVTNDLTVDDDTFLYFGTDDDVGFEYDEDGDNVLKITGADVEFEDTTALFTQDNATSLRIKGASHANSASAGADIQSYTGMFTLDAYNDATAQGTKKNRLTFGANLDMDLVMQGPHQVRIVAADNNVTGGDADTATTNGVGNILMISRSDVVISPWAAAEAVGDNTLVISAETETVADTGVSDGYNGGEINLKVNTGNLYLMKDQTDGAIIVNSLTTTERGNLTGVKGMIIYNETDDEYQVYDGAWKTVDVTAV